jgi:hypothetical protein
MREYSEENNGFNYLLTVIDCFSKYAWGKPIKNKPRTYVPPSQVTQILL